MAQRSISYHLTLLVAVVAVPLVALVLGLLAWSAALSRQAVYRGLERAAHGIGASVDREIGNLAFPLEALATIPSLDCNNLSRFYPAAVEVARQHDAWIVVLDSQGQQRMNTLQPFGAELPRSDLARPQVRDALRVDKAVASDIVRGTVARRPVFFVARPVFRSDRPSCWVIFGLRPERFSAIVRPVSDGESRVGILVDGSGQVIANSAQADYREARPPEWFAKASGLRSSGIANGIWPGVGEVFVAFRHVNAGRWTIAVAAPRAQFVSAWAASVAAVAVGVALILWLSLYVARAWAARMWREVASLVDLAGWLGGERLIALPAAPAQIAEMALLNRALVQADRCIREGRAEHERHVAAEALRVAAEDAGRAKDQFLSMVSHELRTPLAAVLGWIDIAASCGTENPLLRKALDTAKRNAQQQHRIIEDLIDVSRIVSGKFAVQKVPLELATLVHDAIDDCRPAAAEKGVALAARVRSRGLVAADAGRMQQVLGNLIGNAIKFNTAGGWVLVTLEENDGEVEIAVSDNGIGLKADALAHVFDQFWQVARSESERNHGLGLGLALVRHIVELHGGRVAAQSDGPGRGARFSVRLPALVAAARADATPSLPEQTA